MLCRPAVKAKREGHAVSWWRAMSEVLAVGAVGLIGGIITVAALVIWWMTRLIE